MYRIKLDVISGDDGIESKLFERRDGKIVLGRASKSSGEDPAPYNGLFRNALTSRSHCSLVWHEDGIDIEDHSSHGTIINRSSGSTHIKGESMRLQDQDTICLGKEVKKLQSDGTLQPHGAVTLQIFISEIPDLPSTAGRMSSSPYRLELAEQLASEEENELKSEEEPAPIQSTRNVAASDQIAEATSAAASGARTVAEAVQGSLFNEIQKAGSIAGEGSSSGEAASDNLLRLSSPPAEQGQSSSGPALAVLATPSGAKSMRDSAGDATDELKEDRIELREASADPTSRTISADGSPSRPIKSERYMLPTLAPTIANAPAGRAEKPNPSKFFASTASKKVPLALQRTQVVGQSPSVYSRKNRYLDSIQKLNQGGIDQEIASSNASANIKQTLGRAGSQRSSRQVSEEPEMEEKKGKHVETVTSGQISEDMEIPDSQLTRQDQHLQKERVSNIPASDVQSTVDEKGSKFGHKRKLDEVDGLSDSQMSERSTKAGRPIKRPRQSNVWKKFAANTGLFALGAFTAVAGLLLWPDEE